LQAAHAADADEDRVTDFEAAVILESHVKDSHIETYLLQAGGDVEDGEWNLGIRCFEFSWENKQDLFFFAACGNVAEIGLARMGSVHFKKPH
jgi:hypothetical protein